MTLSVLEGHWLLVTFGTLSEVWCDPRQSKQRSPVRGPLPFPELASRFTRVTLPSLLSLLLPLPGALSCAFVTILASTHAFAFRFTGER